jgi:hypothetical protein
VDIPIRCKTAEHEMVEFLAIRVHIVDRLPEGIFLLGLNFIIANALDFRWGRNGSPLHRLQIGDMDSYIPLRTKITKETENPRPVAVYLTETVVLQPGQGQNLPIRHRPLPPTKNGYLFNPLPQADLALDKFGTAMNCITNGTQEPLHFANFGAAPIRIIAGTCLGTLEECPKTTPHPGSPEVCNVFMILADMIQGIPLSNTTEPDEKHPSGYPFLVRPPAEPEPELGITERKQILLSNFLR